MNDTWVLHIEGEAIAQLDEWLVEEDIIGYQLIKEDDDIVLSFSDIADAFRCRLAFDDALVN